MFDFGNVHRQINESVVLFAWDPIWGRSILIRRITEIAEKMFIPLPKSNMYDIWKTDKPVFRTAYLNNTIKTMNPHQNCTVDWDAKRKILSFAKTKQWARGLTRVLTAEFSPEFSFREAISATETKKFKKHGRAQGNHADRLVTAWANKGKRSQTTNDPNFDAIQNCLKTHGWIPVAAQVPVGCEKLRLATNMDLLCQDLDGNFIVIEIKCGFDDYWNEHEQTRFHYPFQDISVSCRNKAFLQLLFTTYFYLHTHQSPQGTFQSPEGTRCAQHTRQSPQGTPCEPIKFGGAYVLHVFQNSEQITVCEALPLPYYFFADKETLDQALILLENSKHKTKKQITKEITRAHKRVRFN